MRLNDREECAGEGRAVEEMASCESIYVGRKTILGKPCSFHFLSFFCLSLIFVDLVLFFFFFFYASASSPFNPVFVRAGKVAHPTRCRAFEILL